MDFVTLLTPLGTAGGIIVAAIVLMREMRKCAPSDKLDGKLDALSDRVAVIEVDVSYIRGKMSGGENES